MSEKKEIKLTEEEREFFKHLREKALSYVDDPIIDNFSLALPFGYLSDLNDDSSTGFEPELGIVKSLLDGDGEPNYGYYKERIEVQRFMLLNYKWNPSTLEHFWALSLETHQTPIEDVDIIHDTIEAKITDSKKIIFIQKFEDGLPVDLSDALIDFFKEVERLSFQSTRHITHIIHDFVDDAEETEDII